MIQYMVGLREMSITVSQGGEELGNGTKWLRGNVAKHKKNKMREL